MVWVKVPVGPGFKRARPVDLKPTEHRVDGAALDNLPRVIGIDPAGAAENPGHGQAVVIGIKVADVLEIQITRKGGNAPLFLGTSHL